MPASRRAKGEVALPNLRGLPRPIALDLFCGGGGAGYGLSVAGYRTVVGVDWKDRPNYAQREGMIFVRGDVRDLTADQIRVAISCGRRPRASCSRGS